MSVLTREDLMAQVKEHFGEATDDASLKFIEDLTDTIDDLETKATNDTEDWKVKYEENDKAWREKYRERFFSGNDSEHNNSDGSDDNRHEEDTPSPKTFEELFK